MKYFFIIFFTFFSSLNFAHNTWFDQYEKINERDNSQFIREIAKLINQKDSAFLQWLSEETTLQSGEKIQNRLLLFYSLLRPLLKDEETSSFQQLTPPSNITLKDLADFAQMGSKELKKRRIQELKNEEQYYENWADCFKAARCLCCLGSFGCYFSSLAMTLGSVIFPPCLGVKIAGGSLCFGMALLSLINVPASTCVLEGTCAKRCSDNAHKKQLEQIRFNETSEFDQHIRKVLEHNLKEEYKKEIDALIKIIKFLTLFPEMHES